MESQRGKGYANSAAGNGSGRYVARKTRELSETLTVGSAMEERKLRTSDSTGKAKSSGERQDRPAPIGKKP